MQQYLNRALSTFLFPLGLIAASFIFIRLRRGWRRQAAVWPLGAALCYGLCVLFHGLKDAALSAGPEQGVPGAYFFSPGRFALNYLMNFGVRLALFGVFIALMRLAYAIDWKRAVSAACTAVAAQTLGSTCFELAAVRYGPGALTSLTSVTASWRTLGLYVALHLLAYLFCWWLFVKKLPHARIGELPGRVLAVVAVITVTLIFSACVSAPPTESEYMAHIVLQITQLILCLTVLLLQYYIIHWFDSQFEQRQLAALTRFQEQHYAVTREQMEAVNQNAHDLKYKLRLLEDALESGETEALHGELAAMGDAIRAWDALFHTGNRALDVVLSEAAARCQREDIRFSAVADGGCLSFMADADVYTLFGNALDNAVEAVRGVEVPEERSISLSLRASKGFALLRLENSYGEAPVVRDGEWITRKADRASHGFGVKSIRSIAEKYGGRATLRAEAGRFTLDVALPVDIL